MIDMHVHLEQGEYTFEWLDKFVDKALNRGIRTLGLLEHSHRFYEFYDMYRPIMENDPTGYQSQWIKRKSEVDLSSYNAFIARAKERKYPIDLRFGLEVCYFQGYEGVIRDALTDFEGDFLTGAIHWIDGWGFDHPASKDTWQRRSVDQVYDRYYKLMTKLVESGLFDIIAHPDSIKCFNHSPSIDMTGSYTRLASALMTTGMALEFNTGLHYRYGHEDLGPSRGFMQVMLAAGVPFITASDAHSPKDVGREIDMAYQTLTSYGYNMPDVT